MTEFNTILASFNKTISPIQELDFKYAVNSVEASQIHQYTNTYDDCGEIGRYLGDIYNANIDEWEDFNRKAPFDINFFVYYDIFFISCDWFKENTGIDINNAIEVYGNYLDTHFDCDSETIEEIREAVGKWLDEQSKLDEEVRKELPEYVKFFIDEIDATPMQKADF
ncbi:hypothetical protein BKH46_08310 [Helicobacter sp. 12S02634-8]|uniref:hypothetical protein n=1 Tax=Helicobacter sp. 12S02634-8 TaxID=1476199 RepID=UPI000BA5073D|nr:hypothetical protein [Helicobacter sp. 12S02634-8]PAF46233.1 hypothetical protein BKH46_08310 [Helicobacter sp. 12S02634-8]